MGEEEISSWRIERLRLAVAKLTEGNVSAFGILMGYRDGAFIRQMLSGSRPISEKTVLKIEEKRGMAGWFQRSAVTSPLNEWPFPKVAIARVLALADDDRGYVQRRLIQAIEECESVSNTHKVTNFPSGSSSVPEYAAPAVPQAPRTAHPRTPALDRENERVTRRGFTGDKTDEVASSSSAHKATRPAGTKRPR